MGIAFRCVLASGGGSGSGGTLTVIGSDVLAGIACTCTDGVTTLTETFPSSAPYNVVFQVPNAGQWTVSVTYHGDTHRETVVISLDQTVDLGIFHLEDWLTAGEVTGTYATLAEVLADELAVRKLCLKHNAVDYLANRFVDTNIEAIFSNDLFAKWTNNSDYALDKYATVSDLVSLMSVSHKELKAMVPAMTSNTTPSGEALANAEATSAYAAWKAFDNVPVGTTPDYWGVNVSTAWLGYHFVKPVIIKRFTIRTGTNTTTPTYGVKTFKIEASNDGFVNDVHELSDVFTFNNAASEITADIQNNTAYLYYRVNCLSGFSYQGQEVCYVAKLQFYTYEYSTKYNLGEWVLKPQVPTMTSNTTPSGVVTQSSIASDTSTSAPGYLAFDGNITTSWIPSTSDMDAWLQYDFGKPVRINGVYFDIWSYGWTSSSFSGIAIKASNDGNTWEPLKENIVIDDISTTSTYNHTIYQDTLQNSQEYRYYRLAFNGRIRTSGSSWILPTVVQFYAYGPKGNVPVMTSNSAPYGEVSGNSVASNRGYWEAFADATKAWLPTQGTNNAYVQYTFKNPVCAKAFSLCLRPQVANKTVTYTLSASKNGTDNFVSLGSFSVVANNPYYVTHKIDNDEYYMTYRVTFTITLYAGSSDATSIREIQFYGRELSVSVPKMATNTTPYGEASASTYYDNNYLPYKAFDRADITYNSYYSWIPARSDAFGSANVSYDFGKMVKLGMFSVGFVKGSTSATNFHYKIQGSTDGTTWEDITQDTALPSPNAWYNYNASGVYRYFRLLYLSNSTNDITAGRGWKLQFYGLDYSEKEFEAGTTKKWLYDHGVELETLHQYPSNYSEFKPNSIVVNTAHNSNGAIVETDSMLDFTSYSLMRAKVNGVENVTYNYSIIGYIETRDSVNLEGYTRATAQDMPNNIGLDISSINQSKYATLCAGSISGGYSVAEFSEWWLE